MRLREYIITLPGDLYDNEKDLCDYASDYVAQYVATDYCIPAAWDVWITSGRVGETDEIVLSVTRVSHGAAFPVMQSGYAYACDIEFGIDIDERDEGIEIEIYQATGREGYQGRCEIYCQDYNYWLCPDGKYRAQLMVLTGR